MLDMDRNGYDQPNGFWWMLVDQFWYLFRIAWLMFIISLYTLLMLLAFADTIAKYYILSPK